MSVLYCGINFICGAILSSDYVGQLI